MKIRTMGTWQVFGNYNYVDYIGLREYVSQGFPQQYVLKYHIKRIVVVIGALFRPPQRKMELSRSVRTAPLYCSLYTVKT